MENETFKASCLFRYVIAKLSKFGQSACTAPQISFYRGFFKIKEGWN